ncbi:retrotransposon protein, partial [Tanacetum coccineum]
YEMILENNGVASKTTKEKVKSLALKAKVTREQTSDDSDSQGESDEDINVEEANAFNLLARNFRKFFRKGNRFRRNNHFDNKANSDGEDDDEHHNDATCLMVIDSKEVVSKPSSSSIDLQKENEELLKFNKDFTKTFKKLLNEKCALEDKNSKLSSKINDIEIEGKKLVNKEVVEPCQKCVELIQEVDSLTSNVSKLQNEALTFSKFKSSGMALDDMLSHDWIVDSDCTKHMTRNRRLFTSYKAYDGGHVVFRSNLKGKVVGGGNITHDSITITNVEHVSGLAFYLINVCQLCDDNCIVSFTKVDCDISKNGKLLAKGHRRNGLYTCKLGDNSKQQTCLASMVDNSTLWHRRLGHTNMRESSLPEPKSSSSIEDDRIDELIVQDLNGSPSLQVNVSDKGYPKSLKEARGHLIEQVIGLNERTLRSKTKQA